MNNYNKLVTDLIDQEAGEYITWNAGTTRRDALQAMQDNGFDNLFGNIDGSRTCNTYEAQKFIDESGAVWDQEIRDLFDEISDEYFTESLARGAETFDVIICELLGSRLISDMIDGAA